jgi:hypothetical protein
MPHEIIEGFAYLKKAAAYNLRFCILVHRKAGCYSNSL